MVLGFNTFGVLGEKNQGYEQVNALFQKLDQERQVNLTTTDNSLVIAHQVFFPKTVAGVYQFRIHATGFNATDDTVAANVVGVVGVTVNNTGVVTVLPGVTGVLLGLKNVSDGADATAVTAVAQSAGSTTPAALNIKVQGTAAKTIYWSVSVSVESYSVNNPNQAPVGTEQGTPLT